jgi:hypothetical protein
VQDPSAIAFPEQLRPLFVLSVWRSGSSLLYALLNQHSKIALLYEGDLPRLEAYLVGRLRRGTWRERWDFWNQGPSRHGISIDSMPVHVTNVWEATRIVYQDYARRKGATIWGEKTPHWYDDPLRKAAHFPDARFIFLWRDMHAVLGSMTRAAATHHFFRKTGLPAKAILGNEELKEACDGLRSQGRAVFEINYEDLTSNTTQHMQQICKFLDLPFEPAIVSLEGADRSAIAGREREHHTLVQGNRIIPQRSNTEMVPPAMRAKIDRYICRWKERYEGEWPKYPQEVAAGTEPPTRIELWKDHVRNQSVMCWDTVVTLAYAATPIAVARMWRSRPRPRGIAADYSRRANEQLS